MSPRWLHQAWPHLDPASQFVTPEPPLFPMPVQLAHPRGHNLIPAPPKTELPDVYAKGRRCTSCNHPLSVYNGGPECWACQGPVGGDVDLAVLMQAA